MAIKTIRTLEEVEAQLSDTMRDALVCMVLWDNKIHRHPGGTWRGKEKRNPMMPRMPGEVSFNTNTVNGLVLRGLATYTREYDGRNGKFAVEAALTETGVRILEEMKAKKRR